MPELPEVEVVKIFLEDKLLLQTIDDIEVINKKSFIGDPSLVIGQKIVKFTRVGKQLSIHLQGGLILLVHLKMTGQLILSPLSLNGVPTRRGILMGHPTKNATQNLPNNSTRIIFRFNKFILYFNDQRKFGWVQIFTTDTLIKFQEKLGYDIFDTRFTSNYLYSQLQRSSRAVKQVLLDQHFFAGIGNIYANDALFISKVHPAVPANKIRKVQSNKIHQHLIEIMRQSVLAGGSTMKDNKYVRPDGSYGGNQFFFRVYQRAGEPCLVCQTPISKITLGGRGTFYCPVCQK